MIFRIAEAFDDLPETLRILDFPAMRADTALGGIKERQTTDSKLDNERHPKVDMGDDGSAVRAILKGL